jgi:hypothetical protein
MRCPVCEPKKVKHTVTPGFTSTTLVNYTPYYDEADNHHDHDYNSSRGEATCSNGHTWTETTYNSCWCGWSGGVSSISVHEEEA